jgi:hypothetical protein
MFTKFIRFVAVLAVIVSIVGNTGVARADRGAPHSVGSQNLDASTLPLVAAHRPPHDRLELFLFRHHLYASIPASIAPCTVPSTLPLPGKNHSSES